VKYEFIEAQRKDHGVRTLCKALQVSASGYYAARKRPPSARAQRQSALVFKIREAHAASRQSYGAPRVHAELVAQGMACCRNTVAKLMRREQIVPRAIRQFRVTTDSRNTKDVSPNLIRRRFRVKRPNVCWLGDITYIPTREGWLYLAAVMDLYSRAIVGWGMSSSLDGRLATEALQMAIARRGVPEIVHTDRGSTYATWAYRDLIAKHRIRQSMSRKGNCWDNAPMESFFHSLKTDLVMHCDYQTRDEARASLFEYMEVFYNRQRRHSTINYVAPLAFEDSSIA
jgi:transposase InsO family protein